MKTLRFTFIAILASIPSLIQAADHGAKSVEGELFVKFRGGPRGAAAEKARRDMRHEVKRNFDFIGWQHVRLPKGMSVEQALLRYRNLPDVLAAVPNAEAEAHGTPNDPLFSQQYALTRIAATNAWAATTGSSNVVVAVVDTGINYLHEDLAPNMWRNPGEIPGNGLDDDGNGHVDDVFGIDTAEDIYGNDSDPADQGNRFGFYHGSVIAGIIGGTANNAKGIAGLNWEARLMALRVFKTNGASGAARLAGFEYATLMKDRGVNLKVINISWGATNLFWLPERDALEQLAGRGVLIVTSTGNITNDLDVLPSYPAAYDIPSIIAVNASDQSDNLWASSSYGQTNSDLAAPGVDILTTGGPGTNIYYTGTGTSFAAPHVVGAAALLFAAHPSATALEVKAALLDSVDQLPAFTNKMVSNGRLNVGRAMQLLGQRLTNAPPNITFQPNDQTVILSNAFNFAATVTGTQPLNFQWLRNGIVTDGTNVPWTRPAATEDAGDYVLVVSNAFGVATSSVARLVVLSAPAFIVHPQNRSLPETSNAVFSALATGYLPRYQWQSNGIDLPGGTSTNLVLTNIHPAFEGPYSLVASNAYGSVTSAVATLTVLTFPRVVEPSSPLRISVVSGETVTLGLQTTGSLPMGYRWRRVTQGLTITNIVLNENQSFLSFVATNSATYTVILTNAAQPFSGMQRTNAIVTVLPDSNTNGLPDDWEANYPNAADPDSDADLDGMTNLQEYRAGTNPTNALDALRIESLTAGTATLLRWTAKSNKTYSVQHRSLVETGAWLRLADAVAASTNRTLEVMDATLPSSNRFYRLVTPRAP